MLIGLFPLQVQWPWSVKAYPPPARWYLDWILRENPFYKSLCCCENTYTYTHKPQRCDKSQILTKKMEILGARGGAAAVCSVAHDMINIGRLLSECFSQDSSHRRVSSEQVWYHVKGSVRFKTTRLRFAILKALANWTVLLSHLPCRQPRHLVLS